MTWVKLVKLKMRALMSCVKFSICDPRGVDLRYYFDKFYEARLILRGRCQRSFNLCLCLAERIFIDAQKIDFFWSLVVVKRIKQKHRKFFSSKTFKTPFLYFYFLSFDVFLSFMKIKIQSSQSYPTSRMSVFLTFHLCR